MSVLKAKAREYANLSQQLRMLLSDATPEDLALSTSKHLDKILPQLRELVTELDSVAYNSVPPDNQHPREDDYTWLFDHGSGD